MAAPLIGITTGIQLDEEGFGRLILNEVYSRSVLRAGGVPLMVPTGLKQSQVDDLRGRLDGLIVTGGPDISHGLYGGEPHPRIYGENLDRDEMDMALVRDAVARKLPLLGICRGFQMINVALGGTLYTDVLDQYPGSLKHDCHPDFPREHEAHLVTLAADSKLANIVGATSVGVNSMHHQGVKRLGDGLRLVGTAPDGMAEAIEVIGHPFGVAVQWHPECMQANDRMQAIFRALVQAAARV